MFNILCKVYDGVLSQPRRFQFKFNKSYLQDLQIFTPLQKIRRKQERPLYKIKYILIILMETL